MDKKEAMETEMMDSTDLSTWKTGTFSRRFNLENWIIINQLFMAIEIYARCFLFS